MNDGCPPADAGAAIASPEPVSAAAATTAAAVLRIINMNHAPHKRDGLGRAAGADVARDSGDPGPDRSPCNGPPAALVQPGRNLAVTGQSAGPPNAGPAENIAKAGDYCPLHTRGRYGLRPDSASFRRARNAL